MAWKMLFGSDVGLLSLITIVVVIVIGVYLYFFFQRKIAEEERSKSGE